MQYSHPMAQRLPQLRTWFPAAELRENAIRQLPGAERRTPKPEEKPVTALAKGWAHATINVEEPTAFLNAPGRSIRKVRLTRLALG